MCPEDADLGSPPHQNGKRGTFATRSALPLTLLPLRLGSRGMTTGGISLLEMTAPFPFLYSYPPPLPPSLCRSPGALYAHAWHPKGTLQHQRTRQQT